MAKFSPKIVAYLMHLFLSPSRPFPPRSDINQHMGLLARFDGPQNNQSNDQLSKAVKGRRLSAIE